MKERPIIFNADMVRAILDGRKTQTRRVVKPPPVRINNDFDGTWDWKDMGHYYDDLTLAGEALRHCCPYGQKNDRLWVRETWTPSYECDHFNHLHGDGVEVLYKADGHICPRRWRPSIFMYRSDSRILLEIADVHAQQLQNISHLDALAEGIDPKAEPNNYGTGSRYRDTFAALWDSINSKRGFGWKSNPWVWVLDFVKTKEARGEN